MNPPSHREEEILAERLVAHALSYVRKGLVVLPLCWPVWEAHPGSWRCGCGRCPTPGEVGKRSLLEESESPTEATPRQVEAWWRKWPLANIGILLDPSGLLVADLDGSRALAEATELGLPRTRSACTGGGFHYYFRRPTGTPIARTTRRGKDRAIDILTSGYVVAPPSRHRTGRYYHWCEQHPSTAPPHWMQRMLLDHQWLTPLPHHPLAALQEASAPYSGVRLMGFAAGAEDLEEERIWDALLYLPAHPYHTWRQVGMALYHWDSVGNGRGRGRFLWDAWSQTYPPKYDPAAQLETWASFAASAPHTLEQLFVLARQEGWQGSEFTDPPAKEPAALLTLDQDKQECIYGGLLLPLTPCDFASLSCLLEHQEGFATLDELYTSYHDPRNPEEPDSLDIREIVKQRIYKLRRKLNGHATAHQLPHITIENRRCFGYRMHLPS